MHNKKALTINDFLISKGIQPQVFYYFINSFIKQVPQKPKGTLKFHLSKVLAAQAELIAYHMR